MYVTMFVYINMLLSSFAQLISVLRLVCVVILRTNILALNKIYLHQMQILILQVYEQHQ